MDSDKERLVNGSPTTSPQTPPIFAEKLTNLTSFAREMRKRQFQIVDCQKSSKPQQLDESEFRTPRSEDSFDLGTARDEATSSQPPPSGILPVPTVQITSPHDRSREVVIQIDALEGIESLDTKTHGDEDPHSLSALGSSNAATRSSSVIEDDVKSQLSFIMKERLHSLAREVHRRTSEVRDDLIKETPEDSVSLTSSIQRLDEHRPSLMSLIGLQKRSESPSNADNYKKIFGFKLKDTINPYGRLYIAWLSIVTICFIYNAFCIPLRSSYPYQTPNNAKYWFAADYSCDLIYLLDMLFIKPKLRFTRGGIQVRNSKETVRHYLMTRTFKLDILSILPTDIFYFIVSSSPIFRLNRLLKINSFWLLFDMLDNSVSNPYAIRIARTLSYMIYIIHCNSCVYYTLSAAQAFGQIAYHENGKWYLNKWVYNNQGNAYIRCFYFTAAVATSTGNNPAPTNVIEYIYMTCSWMMGVFVFALLLGQIRDIVSNANRNREEFQRKMDMALSECHKLGLTKDLTDRVRDWFIYTWQQQKTLDEKKLIEKLPLKLQTDLALSVHYNTLSKVQLFQDCDRALLRDLVLKLRPVIFLPGDMICKKGDVGKEMYIVNHGVLQVVGGERNETVFAELGQGAVFGEISLLAIGGNNRRTASIRSKGYSTLFVLAKEDLNDVIRYYPQAQALLKRKAAQMLKNDKKSDTGKEKEKQQEMEDRCRINPMGTPKMLKIVADILPKDNKTTLELKKAIEISESRRSTIHYPWTTLQIGDEEDDDEWADEDISDVFEDSEPSDSEGHQGDSEDDPLEDMEIVEEKEVLLSDPEGETKIKEE
ncbi:unnamed protein product [Caenorhabditis bovis]|uniref:Cyclic nucleotide-binding domain-containing protein n=1 Tax=Caenorhabditis bovis TaxID=2654633 RepID=A0A8S1F6K9_9PELO|nr:unnamed protein product [Caenorhabditis bovis]